MPPVRRGDGGGGELRDGAKLALDPEGIFGPVLRQAARRDVPVFGGDNVCYVGDGKPVPDQRLLADVHLDFPFQSTDDLDGRQAVDPVEPVPDLVIGYIVDFIERTIGRKRQVHDGQGVEVKFDDLGAVDVFGQRVEDGVNLVLDLYRGQIHVGPYYEFDDDERDVLYGRGADGLDVTDGSNFVLDLFRYLTLHFPGTRSLVDGGDGDHGDVNLRNKVDAEAGI